MNTLTGTFHFRKLDHFVTEIIIFSLKEKGYLSRFLKMEEMMKLLFRKINISLSPNLEILASEYFLALLFMLANWIKSAETKILDAVVLISYSCFLT